MQQYKKTKKKNKKNMYQNVDGGKHNLSLQAPGSTICSSPVDLSNRQKKKIKFAIIVNDPAVIKKML